jgi:hypothetical protein
MCQCEMLGWRMAVEKLQGIWSVKASGTLRGVPLLMFTSLHGVIPQKTLTFISTAVRIANPELKCLFLLLCFNSKDIKYTSVSLAQSVELEAKPQNRSTIEWRVLDCSGHKNIFLCTSLLSLHFASYNIGAYLSSVLHVSYTESGAIYGGGNVN